MPGPIEPACIGVGDNGALLLIILVEVKLPPKSVVV